MRITVIGAGNVGGTLGRRWAEMGHEVTFGVRRPEEGISAIKGGGAGPLPSSVKVALPADAVRGAEVVVLTTPWGAVADALREAGASSGSLDGVVLVDATNPIGAGLRLDVGPDGAAGAERVQALAPAARVVKAFNTTGWENMRDPVYAGAPTMMCYAGDDAAARRMVHSLANDLGFDPVDAGPLTRARELEHLAILWIALAVGAGVPAQGRGIAFRLVRR